MLPQTIDILLAPSGGRDLMARMTVSLFGLRRFGKGTSIEFHLPHREMLRLLRSCGFVVEDLIEIQAPQTAPGDYSDVSTDWARRWPNEEIWSAHP